MYHGFMPGTQQPDQKLKPQSGRSFAGAPIGILLVEADYAMLPGNVANASTYDFPVLYQVLEGVTFERIAAADPGVLDVLIAGGEALIANGVRAVVSACGSFANYQRAAAAALSVPTYLSSMLQVPWIQAAMQRPAPLRLGDPECHRFAGVRYEYPDQLGTRGGCPTAI